MNYHNAYTLAPYSNELYHWGVKGMKWGVRRYQNPNGSLTAAGKKRLSDYKKKELAANDKKYSSESYKKRDAKLTAKIAKAKEAGKTEKVKKLTADKALNEINSNYNDIMRKVERSKVMKMTYSQMQKEKSDVRNKHIANTVESILLTGLGTATILPSTGLAYAHVRTTNYNKYKTSLRTTEEERKNAYREAIQTYSRG